MHGERAVTLTNTNDIELETALQELALNLRCDTVKTDMAARVHRLLGSIPVLNGCHSCKLIDKIRYGSLKAQI
jgi:hypothetical protein